MSGRASRWVIWFGFRTRRCVELNRIFLYRMRFHVLIIAGWPPGSFLWSVMDFAWIALRFVDALLGNFGSKEDAIFGAQFTDQFKRDAVAQVLDRGYPTREVAERLTNEDTILQALMNYADYYFLSVKLKFNNVDDKLSCLCCPRTKLVNSNCLIRLLSFSSIVN